MTEPSGIGISGVQAARALLVEALEKIASAKNLISGYAENGKNGPGRTMRARLTEVNLETLGATLEAILGDVGTI